VLSGHEGDAHARQERLFDDAQLLGQGLGMALIDPGKPWQNGMVESFNGKFRDECLSMEWFRSRTEAQVVIEDWRRTYNEVRPHSSLGKMTPGAYARMVGNTSTQGATLKN
jgi:putative transposase